MIYDRTIIQRTERNFTEAEHVIDCRDELRTANCSMHVHSGMKFNEFQKGTLGIKYSRTTAVKNKESYSV